MEKLLNELPIKKNLFGNIPWSHWSMQLGQPKNEVEVTQVFLHYGHQYHVSKELHSVTYLHATISFSKAGMISFYALWIQIFLC